MADAGRSVPEHLVVGHVAKAHGTKGELFVMPLTDSPDEVFAEGASLLLGNADGELDDESTEVVIEESRPFKRGELLKLAGIEDRTAAELLAGRYLLAPTAALVPPAEGELYYHQLLGMQVVTTDGERVGRVREVFEAQPADLLEVKADDGRLHLIPFAERIVRSVDVAAGRLVIEPPPGLLEL